MIVLVTSLGILFKLLIWDSYFSSKTNDQAKEIYYNNDLKQEEKISSLEQLNTDICGWIHISGTRIDYPVLKATKDDPEFYLSHNHKGEKSKYGSIFIDPNCSLEGTSKNTIIYGHHMADGQMFADLMKFSDVEFYKQNPIIDFNTSRTKGQWKIISVFKTNTLSSQGEVFNYVIPDFKSGEEFLKYVEEVKKRSLITTNIDVNKNDKLITLSTCSYELESFRTVVVARKVRSDESSSINVSLVSKAPNPLMPKGWYDRYGGSPPE